VTGTPDVQPATSESGARMYALIASLYPICRSLTGNGVRATLREIEAAVMDIAPMAWTEVPTGTKVLDWEIPDEWNLREAYLEDEKGNRVVDTARSNLHVMSYSEPADVRLDRDALDRHLHSLADRPDAIPYRTSYYARRWAFCLSHAQRTRLGPGMYRAVVDATLKPGSLTYGEIVLPGDSAREVLLVTHVCHPSLCNDNLSGIAVAVELIRRLAAIPQRHYTYRFLFSPATLGAITWLSRERGEGGAVARIAHGLVLTGLGDGSAFTFKRTRSGATIDQVCEHVLRTRGVNHRVIDFGPYGYDERQFCSPGFDLPVARLCRATHGEHPEYHTSNDNLEFVRPEHLAESLDVLNEIVETLDRNHTYRSTSPYGEPQLGRRGLFRNLGGVVPPDTEMALLWLLNQSDGTHSLLDVAQRAGLPFGTVHAAAMALREVGLLS
jgi:aminopeptidase-like protein